MNKNQNLQDGIVVVGGGASGLMASIMAARQGVKVTLLEHNDKLGKKLLATGNGRCNMTNVNSSVRAYRGSVPEFAQIALSQFTVADTIQFFSELGIYTKNKNGWIYPASLQAASVLEVLEMEARYLKVKCKTREKVTAIRPEKEGYLVETAGWSYPCRKVILACGSKASGIEGADGSGYSLAEQLGLTVVPPLPALVPLRCKTPGNDQQKLFSRWAGVRIEGQISLEAAGECFLTEKGELQLTDYGISGIPVFQLSRYAVRLIQEGQSPRLLIDFFPDLSPGQLENFLAKRLENCPYKNLKESLIGLFPKKLIEVLIEGNPNLKALTERIKDYVLIAAGAVSLEQAQVCSGGVDTRHLCPETMEVLASPGVYICGELADIDGACGGYNLQWAWTSGALAGMAAAQAVRKEIS